MWRPYVGFHRLDGNHHIYRKGKFGPKFGTRRKGCSLVALGKGYKTRNLYGWRLLHYSRDGSCISVDLFIWNGKQQ